MIKFKKDDKIKGIGSDIIDCEGIIEKIRPDGYSIRITKNGGHSWQQNDSEFQVGNLVERCTFWENSIVLIKRENKNPTHIILCNNHDYIIVYGKKERDDVIKKLVDNKDVNNDDIIVYDIKHESKVKCEVIIEEIK